MQPILAKKHRRIWATGALAFLGAWLIWSGVTFAMTTRTYIVPSGSMAPTIRPGDRIGVSIDPSLRPQRREVWVIRFPRSSGKAPNEAIKRIIGLPGETVEVVSGQVKINGRPIDEPYLATPPSYTMPPITLGPREFFVLGDSRDNSFDSHTWGPLPADHLVGRVQMRIWPMKRIGGL
jgi:signal peptidase I